MRPKALARRCMLGAMGAVVAFGTPAVSHPVDPSALVDALPLCLPRAAPTRAPAGPPRLGDPAACRVTGSRAPDPRGGGPVRESTGRDTAGYRHLGAGTVGEWSGVSGRLTVTDPAVRADSYDFLAARFMAKRRHEDGSVAWLEAGWAETGWSGDGRQRIYTYDTNRRTWRFYDEFVLRPGDQVWLDVHADADGVWQAWLWWDDRWNLLSSETLPIGTTAHIEQYVELHVDADRPARLGAVPPVGVHDVHLVEPDGSAARPWREDVETVTGDAARERAAGLCLTWTTRFDTWSAGDCPAPARSDADPQLTEPQPATPQRAAVPPPAAPPQPPEPVTTTTTRPSATTDRPRGTQPADARPVDEEPASVVGTPAPTATRTPGGLLRPLLGR